VTTRDLALADRVRMLRFHGSWDKVTYEHVGYNSRLDELQAAILRVQLPHLDRWADGRRAASRHYEAAGLDEVADLPRPTVGAHPAWHLYVIRSERADAIAEALGAAGHGHKAYYRTPVHRQPAMRAYADGPPLPATDEVARTHLAIPMSPVLTAAQAAEVVAAARMAGPAARAA
jgi:dTDP-4-amino-4,6-dideoxygalactose transaminase